MNHPLAIPYLEDELFEDFPDLEEELLEEWWRC
ncbi:uncharacterized protein (DUF433 family) [Amycolatopsis lexingtonensis]|uniref:Uncharacterized protein (DUF433 family) n=1 Tax=Amycolatopsis lexingtonensis TaxID=218822 RepID=A0ABR9IET9_9PSEU|nr:uncharacterized protein (DUF433 family) [Amycolatopsis lexingtonensis]